MGWNPQINFINNITPLDHEHLNQLVENLKYLYDIVINLIPAAGTNVTPLPTASGDGIIRYVVSVNRDMIWTSTTPPPSTEREDEGRYFVAVYEEYEYSKYRYHLEIWKWEGTGWWTNENWSETDAPYTEHCWDKCTHDKLYICKNTNKCYYMNRSDGKGWTSRSLQPGTTNQAKDFMTETAQACRCIWTGTRHGDTGIPRSWLYRYKVVTLSFDINDGDSHYPVDSDKHPLLSVTFDPWWNHGDYVFVPIVNPYNVTRVGAVGSEEYGVLKILNTGDADDRFKFYAHIGSSATYKEVYIRAIVGVADISLGWEPEHTD